MLSATLLMLMVVQTPESKPTDDPKAAATEVKAATPEEAMRSFMAAMICQEEEALRELTLPNEEFEWLLRGDAAPKEVHQQIKDRIAEMPVEVFKEGDEIMLPGGRKQKVKAEEVGEDRAVVMPEGAPIPTRLRKVEGRWRVDATPIIAGRKAADAARKKAAGAAKKSEP